MRYSDKISVLMPAHNEGHHIFNNILETFKAFERFCPQIEIVVINDGSTDNTSDEILRLQKNSPTLNLVFVDLKQNIGKGGALKAGFKKVTGDVVVFLDADLELPPHQIEFLIDILNKNNADVVIGCKQHPLSKINYPTRRKIVSWIYSKILLVLFNLPLRDTQTGLKVFKKKVLDDVFPVILSKEFAYDIEVLVNAHHLGYKIVEAPVILNFKRFTKWGSIPMSAYYKTGNDTLAVFYRLKILKYYDKVRRGEIKPLS